MKQNILVGALSGAVIGFFCYIAFNETDTWYSNPNNYRLMQSLSDSNRFSLQQKTWQFHEWRTLTEGSSNFCMFVLELNINYHSNTVAKAHEKWIPVK